MLITSLLEEKMIVIYK